MIVFVALLGLITLLGVQKRKKEEPFLSKEMTTTVNGIFVLCIFLTHSSEYISFSGVADSLYRHFQNFHNQWIVTTFFGVFRLWGYEPNSKIWRCLFGRVS